MNIERTSVMFKVEIHSYARTHHRRHHAAALKWLILLEYFAHVPYFYKCVYIFMLFLQAYHSVVVSYILRIWSVQQTHRAAVFLQNRIHLHTCW